MKKALLGHTLEECVALRNLAKEKAQHKGTTDEDFYLRIWYQFDAAIKRLESTKSNEFKAQGAMMNRGGGKS